MIHESRSLAVCTKPEIYITFPPFCFLAACPKTIHQWIIEPDWLFTGQPNERLRRLSAHQLPSKAPSDYFFEKK